MTLFERIARWLAPGLAQDADSHWYLRIQLSCLQDYLAYDFPAVDAAIHFAKVKTQNHFRRFETASFSPVPGKPWINDFHEFREYLKASVDTLPKGRDVKQARCVSKGSAVANGETPKA